MSLEAKHLEAFIHGTVRLQRHPVPQLQPLRKCISLAFVRQAGSCMNSNINISTADILWEHVREPHNTHLAGLKTRLPCHSGLFIDRYTYDMLEPANKNYEWANKTASYSWSYRAACELAHRWPQRLHSDTHTFLDPWSAGGSVPCAVPSILPVCSDHIVEVAPLSRFLWFSRRDISQRRPPQDSLRRFRYNTTTSDPVTMPPFPRNATAYVIELRPDRPFRVCSPRLRPWSTQPHSRRG